MANEVDGFLANWQRVVATRDLEALASILDPEISVGAPPYWARLQGHAICHHLLGLILYTIDDFTYHREWSRDRELALEFTGKVGEFDLQGIDLISLGEGPLIARLDVLIRPMNALESLRDIIAPQMAAFLSRGAGGEES